MGTSYDTVDILCCRRHMIPMYQWVKTYQCAGLWGASRSYIHHLCSNISERSRAARFLFKCLLCMHVQSNTFVQTFGVQSKTFVQTFWVQSNTFAGRALTEGQHRPKAGKTKKTHEVGLFFLVPRRMVYLSSIPCIHSSSSF